MNRLKILTNKLNSTKITTWIFYVFIISIFVSNALLQICAVLIIPFIFLTLKEKYHRNSFNKLDILILLLFTSSVISIFTIPTNEYSLRDLPVPLLLLSTIAFSYHLQNAKELKFIIIVRIIIITASITSVIGIARFANGLERSYAFYGGYTTLANILVFSITISLGWFIYLKSWSKFLVFLSVALQASAIWFTFSRGAIIAVVLIILTVTFIHFIKGSKKRLLQTNLLAFISILVIGLFVLFKAEDPRINPILILKEINNEDFDVTSGRASVYNDAKQVLTKSLYSNPLRLLFGYGMRSRNSLFPESRFTSWESEYTEIIISQGVIGLIIIISIYVIFFKKVIRLLRSYEYQTQPIFFGFALSGVGLWLFSFFGSQLFSFTGGACFAVIFSMIEFYETSGEKSINFSENILLINE